MANDFETAPIKQDACMIEQLVFERESASALAMTRSGIEQQHGVIGRVRVKYIKHCSLGFVRKVEIAIPCKDASETPVECEHAHISDYPLLVGHSVARHCDHLRRSVDSSHMQSAFDQETRDRFAPTAA